MGKCCSKRSQYNERTITSMRINNTEIQKYSTEKTPITPIASDTLVACLAQECSVSVEAAKLELQNNQDISSVIANLFDSRLQFESKLLPPLAAIVLQDFNSFTLCSKKTAMMLIAHRVTGDLSAADKLLRKIFASAQEITPEETKASCTNQHEVPAQTFECPVCYDDVAAQEATRLSNCSHKCCTSCLRDHVQSFLRRPGSSLNVPCFQSDCTKLMTKHEVLSLCPQDTIKVAIARAIDDLIATDHCLKRCDTAGCNHVYHFCPVRMKTSITVCPRCNQELGKPTVEQLLEEERALQKLMKKYKVRRCARCGSGVQKAHGCNKMMCRCGYRFCYVCGSENAQCGHTPSSHGFINNLNGRGDFTNLRQKISPDSKRNASLLGHSNRPRCNQNHHLALSRKSGAQECAICHTQATTYYSCIAGCKFHVCAQCYLK